MRVLFAPDWRQGVPYQQLLAEALIAQGIEISFLSHYKRVLPLARQVPALSPDLFHLHWPEAYYPRMRDRWDLFRRARFNIDLWLAIRHMPLVVTAHNLCEHNLQHLPFAYSNYAASYRRARVIFAHSAIAAERLVETYGVSADKIRLVPHGDLSVVLPPPTPRDEARKQLGLPLDRPLCLMFGVVEPYKGQQEVLEHWRKAKPAATLVIAGRPRSAEYGATIRQGADGLKNVLLRLNWLDNPTLALYLSAADCALFNYRTIFTSGAASLARSWGLPILLPSRLDTVDLAEPTPGVRRFDRFETDFDTQLAATLAIPADYAGAAAWREQIGWRRVAELTVAGYRSALGR